MADYDFTSCLSPLDFELLSKDLLEAELGIRLENFSEGRDKGIDLRYAPLRGAGHAVFNLASLGIQRKPPELIVQCKRYSEFSDLKSTIKNKELAKIQKLQPARYILTTSVSLSPQQAEDIKTMLSPFVQSTGDIYGQERLNSLLTKHPEIERRHIKLWVASAGVLDSIINAGTHLVSREEVERTLAAAKIYVRNTSFDEALTILKQHHVCIISGLPGIGKTTLARMLLLYFYERKFDVVKIVSDVSEARAVGYHNNPRFYYYDDFLGQTAQADKLNKNEDQKLLDFMTSVRDSKDSVLVLTTREYILNQARLHYEKLDREKFDHRTCVIDLSKYSRRIRAEILYNHLHFSDLPLAHLAALVAGRGYLRIVDHKNYNPRLIEFLTSAAWVGKTPSENYVQLFLGHLDNPVAIWEHAFRNQISDAARHLLFVLTTLPTELILSDLEGAFGSLHKAQCSRFGIPHSAIDFKRALKELDGTFVATRKIQEFLLVRFQNPSIRDFLQNLLLGGECLAESIESLHYFEQAQWFFETLHEKKPQVPLKELSKQARSIADAMQRLINAPSCAITVEGAVPSQRVNLHKVNEASRLALIAASVQGVEEAHDSDFIATRIAAFAERLETGKSSPSSCLSAIEPLRALGHLSTAQGQRFVSALKASATNEPSDFDEFETLAGVIDALPDSFTSPELEEIKDAYAGFADDYARDCATGRLDLDDPEVIREEASRVDYIGELLGVDTKAAQKAIRDYATKKEQESEEDRDWDGDDDGPRGGGSSEECSDGDIDSMFGTLGS